MGFSSVLITWASMVLMASSVLLVSGTYTVDSSNPCTKEFIRRMAIQMCSRHKRDSENETKADSFTLTIHLPIPLAAQKTSTVPSSLDTLLYGLLGPSDQLKDLIDVQDQQRIERAEKTLMNCCVHPGCSSIDFANAC